MKYRCLIVDDEPLAQQILVKYISNVEALEVAGVCGNAIDAFGILHREKVDILFLDIQMPVMTGLEMLKTMRNSPYIILTTAFSEFGVESYDYGVTDYLLKPFSFERFLFAVNKILIPRRAEMATERTTEKMVPESAFIFFKADKRIHKLYFSDILFIEGSGNYIKVHSLNEKPLLSLEKLSDLSGKLPQGRFIRVHKSFIVNTAHISRIEGNLVLIRNVEIPISATYRHHVEEFLKNNGQMGLRF